MQRLPAGVGGDLLLAAGRCSGFTTALHRTNVASEVCLIHHHSPPRAANPLASRGQLSPYRPQHHALFILRAEALRTCRAAQSLCASLSPTDVALLRCVAFCLLSFCSVHSCPPSGDRLEGPPLRNRFYSRPRHLQWHRAQRGLLSGHLHVYCWDLEAQRHRPICQP